MGWFIKNFSSSIGKKQIMAITGLIFCTFLTTHLLGNLSIYGGKGSFNSYAEHLHSLGVLIHVAEVFLIIFAVLHISMAVILYFQTLSARPVRYVKKKNAGGRTISSTLMPYTGLIILIFVVAHLINFHFADHTNQTIFDIVSNAFSKPVYVISYVFVMIVAAFHVKHGLWSAFQTIGANHPKYMPFIMAVSLIFSLIVVVGFASIPVYIFSSI